MKRKKINRNGKIFDLKKEELEKVIKESKSIKEVLLRLKYSPRGNQFFNLKQRCKEDGISLKFPRKHNKIKSIDYYLRKDFYVSSVFLKKKLLSLNLIEKRCYAANCIITESWLGMPLTLQLDHINGDCSDNRIENLRLLCPNCHSQTVTYSGRNQKFKLSSNMINFNNDEQKYLKNFKEKCFTCNGFVSKTNKSKRCSSCFKNDLRKKRLELIEKVKPLLGKEPLILIAKKYNMSGNALKKNLVKEGIDYPKKEYWSNFHKEKFRDLYKNKEKFSIRKYDYDLVYNTYLKNDKSYAKTGRELNMDRSTVRGIVAAHKRYLTKK